MSNLDFDISRSLDAKCDGAIELAIYGLVSVSI